MQARIQVNRDDDPGIVAETFAQVLNEMGIVKITNTNPDGEDSTEYLIETLEGKDSLCSTGSQTSS